MNSNIFKKDKLTYYVDYIKKEAFNYKINIVKKKRIVWNRKFTFRPSFNTTKELIYNDSELILQGKLLNKDNVFVKCDYNYNMFSLFKKIFPKINNIPFHLYCTNDKSYLLINICYNTFHFKIDLQEVQNENYIFYKNVIFMLFKKYFTN